MNANGIRFKIRLICKGDLKEMRRLQIDDALFASDFELFKEKLRATFVQLRGNAFKVTWTDCDGDRITIANDDDLIAALMEMDETKLFNVEIDSNEDDDHDEQDEEPDRNAFNRITCDVCNCLITRYRYKCLQCPDYDLCMNCEQAGNHSHHFMMRLANMQLPQSWPKIVGQIARTARKTAHHAAKEAHRAAKTSARMAHAAASSIGRDFRCPKMHSRSASNSTGFPIIDAADLGNMAKCFFETLNRGVPPANNANAPTAQSPTQNQEEAETNRRHEDATQQMVDTVGRIFENVTSAMRGMMPQATTSAATPASDTPANGTEPASMSSAASEASAKNLPMDVEQENLVYPSLAKEQPMATAPPKARETGWTFIAQPDNATALKPEDEKYADALQQLQRMGFSQNMDLLGLLKRYNGNIGFVVNHLFEKNTDK